MKIRKLERLWEQLLPLLETETDEGKLRHYRLENVDIGWDGAPITGKETFSFYYGYRNAEGVVASETGVLLNASRAVMTKIIEEALFQIATFRRFQNLRIVKHSSREDTFLGHLQGLVQDDAWAPHYSHEELALRQSENKRFLKKRLNETRGCLHPVAKQFFKSTTFDFEGKRLIGSKGRVLQWQTRPSPDAPEGYRNQQMRGGYVTLVQEITDDND